MPDIVRVIAFAALLGGGAAAGVQVTEQQAKAFQAGRSTYAEVVAALGEPTSMTSLIQGDRVAVYSYEAVASRPQNFIPYVGYFVAGYDTKSSAVTFVFDSRDILKQTRSTQHNIGVGDNLAARSPQGAPNPLMPAR